MVEQKLPKLTTRVRFPSPAPSSPHRFEDSALSTLTNISDTVRMPWTPTGTEDIVVRPSLGNSFRSRRWARWPSAWVPRFLRYERDGRAAVCAGIGRRSSFPRVWAFYRRLWVTGGIMAALPFGLRGAFTLVRSCARRFADGVARVRRRRRLGRAGACSRRSPPTRCCIRRVKREVRQAEASSGAEGRSGVAAARPPPHGAMRSRSGSAAPSSRCSCKVTRAGARRAARTARRARERGRRARRGRAAAAAGRGAVGAHRHDSAPARLRRGRGAARRGIPRKRRLEPEDGPCPHRAGAGGRRGRPASRCCSRRRSTASSASIGIASPIDVPRADTCRRNADAG